MPDSTKETQATLRALLDQMAKALAEPKPVEPGPGYKTRVNVREFLRGQGQGQGQGEGDWWDDSGDEDAFIGLRPRPKPRAKRRLR